MAEEILTLVRLPLADLAEEVRRKHGLAETLVDARVEGEALVMYFSRVQPTPRLGRLVGPSARAGSQDPRGLTNQMEEKRRRRAKGKRNRMKTRGWPVIGRFVNSQGQTAVIYRPFVEALKEKRMTPTEQKAVVAQILRANGNRPSAGSIEYYWMNTVEYLRQQSPKEEVRIRAN